MLLSQTQAPTSEEGLRQRKMTRQKLILQLNEVIATECVLCGEIAVKTVDKAFYDAIDAGEWLKNLTSTFCFLSLTSPTLCSYSVLIFISNLSRHLLNGICC